VELADGGVPCLQHLDVQPSRDVFELLGRDRPGEAVHQVTPAPKIVSRLRAEFGEAGKDALEGVRVQIRHAWQHGTV
jgi:hypothetical protein